VTNADPNQVADLHACSGCGGHQGDPPSRMSMRYSDSDRKDQQNSGCRHQDHDFEALSQQRTNQQTDH
jgi:hypothetical protein